jgi:decaprenyl-phosphate phosphoribosyltransferase
MAAKTGSGAVISAYFTMLRPAQWLKNLMLFFPLFLGGQLLRPGAVTHGLIPLGAFCLVSSASYLFNDILDRQRDALHPLKSRRPIPAGLASVSGAAVLAALLLLAGIVLALPLSSVFLGLLLAYATISLAYSLLLKTMPVVDLFCISAGFLLRLQAGGEVFQVPISPWLFLSVFLLAIFLSTGKRLCECRILGTVAGKHRKSLEIYPPGFLDGTMYMTGSAVLVTYAMYSLIKPRLLYSVPLCVFGLLRYMLRVQTGENGDPTESLLKDPVLLTIGITWVFMVAWSIYW